MIDLTHLHLKKDTTVIINDVSASIEPEKITALIGPNGSGKSTLLSILSGLTAPDSGKVLIDGKNITDYKRRDIAQKLALLPQKNTTPASITVKDLVGFGRHPYKPWYKNNSDKDNELIHWAMKECGVDHYQDTLLSSLSGGEVQRCWLAMILAQDTPIVLLDEPTSWLDIPHQVALLNIVKKLNQDYKKTIVWVLHDLNQALEYSHNAILLNHGKVISEGDVNQVITREHIQNVYNIDMQPHKIGEQTIFWVNA